MLCIRGTSHGPVSVRLCLCLSQVRVLLKWLNRGSHKQHYTIAQGVIPYGVPNTGGVGQNRRLSANTRLYLENGTR